MTRTEQIQAIVRLTLTGALADHVAHDALDALSVQGGFQDNRVRYVGFDYAAQSWLQVSLYDMAA